MFTNAVVTELKKIVSESIDATRSKFPDRDAWRKLDADGVWKIVVYQVAVVGGSASYERLVNSETAQSSLHYDNLDPDDPGCLEQINYILRSHGVRYASSDVKKCAKSKALLQNLEFLKNFPGGPTGYMIHLSKLPEPVRINKVMKDFSYIKHKGARDLLAELGLAVDIIALDTRVLGILRGLGADVPENTPNDDEQYLAIQQALLTQVCKPLGITGVELDRVLYWNHDKFRSRRY